MKNTKLIIVLAAAMAVACGKSAFVEDLSRSTLPYSLKVTATKVAYNGTNYSMAEGDRISLAGKTRTDIEGLLEYNSISGEWEGEVSYLTALGEPDTTTDLVATLIHAANADQSTYANAILGSSVSSQLNYAAEHYSLFTADLKFGDSSTTLSQKAAFLDVTVTFTFDGGAAQMYEGTTYVDLETSVGTTSGSTSLVAVGDDFQAQFLAVVPGGLDVKDFTINICDRQIVFSSSAILSANKKYTVNRTIEFKPQLGDPFWSDGTYGRLAHPSGVNIVGIITYVNDGSDIGKGLTEEASGFGHALVMALENSNEGVQWGTNTQLHTTAITKPQHTLNVSTLSGYANTATQYASGITAAVQAKGYLGGTNYGGATTGWFLPSIGQWMYTISTRGFGGADPVEDWINGNHKNWLKEGGTTDLIYVKRGTTNENVLVTSLNRRLQVLADDFGISYDSFGMTSGNDFADNYWTSSEKNADEAYRMNFGSVEQFNGAYYSTIKASPLTKSNTWAWKRPFIMKVRPFLAF